MQKSFLLETGALGPSPHPHPQVIWINADLTSLDPTLPTSMPCLDMESTEVTGDTYKAVHKCFLTVDKP